jgi:V/A-type H+/Na+-transporting ATPase subunit C
MGEFGYANARLRAMKGRLFGRDTYNELLDLERIDDVIAHLAQSAYAPEIDAALARYSGLRVVLEGCRLHLAHTLHTIRGFFDEDDAHLIHALLARYDLHNIKTILRGQQADAPPEEILAALIPAGALDDTALRALLHESHTPTMIELLRAWNVQYAKLTRAAFQAWRDADDWAQFETTLDGSFYTMLLDQLGDGKNDRYVREFIVREIDTANVLTALRLRSADVGEAEPTLTQRFLPGGQVARSWLLDLIRQSRDDLALQMLRQSRFAEQLGALDRLDVAGAQRALDRHLVQWGQGFWGRDPLSIAPAIAYITAKRAEVMNVRLIGQGVALGLHRAEIERELI